MCNNSKQDSPHNCKQKIMQVSCVWFTVKPVLNWDLRRRIVLGAARGMLYLHKHCHPKLICTHNKASTVLLDEYLKPVVGDFGPTNLLDHRDSHVTIAFTSTVGRISPEYLSIANVKKSCVFSRSDINKFTQTFYWKLPAKNII